MQDLKIVVTGDYWHRDFKNFLSGIQSVTLVPIEQIETFGNQEIDLVIIAQSRREQFSLTSVEDLQQQFGNTPMVSVLGSWCEGEVRSGTPFPGIPRVYWHQFAGRFDNFVWQLRKLESTFWHQPRTTSVADRILKTDELAKRNASHLRSADSEESVRCVGISSWTQSGFEMISDAVTNAQWQCRWIERTTWDADSTCAINPIVVDADSLTPDLQNRFDWLSAEFPNIAFVVLLNFPRSDDFLQLSKQGVSQVVSKPFELNDLKVAIENAFAARIIA